MRLIGTREILDEHGLDRTQVHRLIQSGDWPQPIGETGGGRLWHERDVEQAVERLRLAGRIASQGEKLVLVPRRYLPEGV